MKTDPAIIMPLDASSGQERSSSSIAPTTNEALPPSVVHVSRDDLRKFLKCKRVGNYLLGKTIGEGSFAKVKQGFHVLTGEKVAVKVIDKKQAMEDRYVSKNMRREAKILQMVRHPHVIQLLEVVETENRYYLVFEIAGGGDLMDYVCYRKKLGEIEVRKFIRQIISAVHYLHQGGIIHRDLKVENLLLDENYDIKIIDFGLSNTINVSRSGERSSSRDHCKTQCGSPAYAAPEILGHLTYGTKVDVWSIGVNMYAMLTGKLPYTAEPFNIITLYNKMVKGEMNPIPDRISSGCKDLMLRFLTFDPKERISIEEAIHHPWLRKGFEDSPLAVVSFPTYLRPDELNNDIINHMADKMQFKTKDVIEGVSNNKANAASCVYHLMNRKLRRYLDKHVNTVRILRRTKSRDDETDAVPKKQRIEIDFGTNQDDQIVEKSRKSSLTSHAFRSGAGSSLSSRGIRNRSGSSSQGSQGPRVRLASDRDGTELKGSITIPDNNCLDVPHEDVQRSGDFNQLSVEIEDEELEADVEGHDPNNRKVSMTYEYLSDKKHLSNLPSHLTIQEHAPKTIVIDNNNNNGLTCVTDDVFAKDRKDPKKTEAEQLGKERKDFDEGYFEKDAGMNGEMISKAYPDNQQEHSHVASLESALDTKSRNSVSASEKDNELRVDPLPITRPRRGSLTSRTYPVTRDPSPIRKSNKQADSEMSHGAETAASFGFVCQVVEKNHNEDVSEPAQLMLRSTLSPLSVHCSPKPTRRYSTPANPLKDVYKEVLGFDDKSTDGSSQKVVNEDEIKGTRSLSRPFGSPAISRRTSASSTSSDDRSSKSNRIPLPVTPREPLLPNLELKLLTKHPPIESMSASPLSPRKFSLDSKTKDEKSSEKRRRNTIMSPPCHSASSQQTKAKESRVSSIDNANKSIELEDKAKLINQGVMQVPPDASRDSDSNGSSQSRLSGRNKVRARVTVKQRRQTTELDTRKKDLHSSKEQHNLLLCEKERYRNKSGKEGTSETQNDRHEVQAISKQPSKSRDGGKLKARVTIKERRQTTELDTRATRLVPRVQFKITDSYDITRPQLRDMIKHNEGRPLDTSSERRLSFQETSRHQYCCPIVRRSSVPVLNSEEVETKELQRSLSPQEPKKKQPSIHRTLSDSSTRDRKGVIDMSDFGNPWLKHDKTIQRTVAMRAEMARRKAEDGKHRGSIDRARRHTVSTNSPITTTTKHKLISSPRTIKKSLV